MDIHQLETFLAVAEEKGFSRAAKRLHRTQPAVSQVVHKLESDLGEVLFERSARDGTLTAAGEVLLDYARRMLSLRADAASAMEELKSLDRGRLLIAAMSTPVSTCSRFSIDFGACAHRLESAFSARWPAGSRTTSCSERWKSASSPSVRKEILLSRSRSTLMNWRLWSTRIILWRERRGSTIEDLGAESFDRAQRALALAPASSCGLREA